MSKEKINLLINAALTLTIILLSIFGYNVTVLDPAKRIIIERLDQIEKTVLPQAPAYPIGGCDLTKVERKLDDVEHTLSMQELHMANLSDIIHAISILAGLELAGPEDTPVLAAGTSHFSNIETTNLDVLSNLSVVGTASVGNSLSVPVNFEHPGLPSVISTNITYTAATGGTGAVTTIISGETWLVWGVFVEVTTDFDCTGDDATLIVGDGNDPDGFVILADAELQAADTEQTGSPAGWQGLVAATMGVFLDGAVSSAPHIYDAKAAAETIDWLVSETTDDTLTAGAATIYVVYTKLE